MIYDRHAAHHEAVMIRELCRSIAVAEHRFTVHLVEFVCTLEI